MKTRSAFTLVELVVVIMILGILAGVAAPKLLNTSSQASTNGLRQTLSVVRNAIELYAAQNGGALPPSGTELQFKTALDTYLRGDFPACPFGAGDDSIQIVTADEAGNGTHGWIYNSTSGEFICDDAAYDDF